MSKLISKPKWVIRAAQSLLPLSVEKNDLAESMREWRYSNRCSEAEWDDESCELCGLHPIRYMFEIINVFTGHRLWVGSECIRRFGILGQDDQGEPIDASLTKSKLSRDRRKLIADSRYKRVIGCLIELAAKDDKFDIDGFIDYVKGRGAFTPKQMTFLSWRFKEMGIPHNPADFKIIIRRKREKAQLRTMSDWKLKKLMPYMSKSQQIWILRSDS